MDTPARTGYRVGVAPEWHRQRPWRRHHQPTRQGIPSDPPPPKVGAPAVARREYTDEKD